MVSNDCFFLFVMFSLAVIWSSINGVFPPFSIYLPPLIVLLKIRCTPEIYPSAGTHTEHIFRFFPHLHLLVFVIIKETFNVAATFYPLASMFVYRILSFQSLPPPPSHLGYHSGISDDRLEGCTQENSFEDREIPSNVFGRSRPSLERWR